jgi:hypothetical protein
MGSMLRELQHRGHSALPTSRRAIPTAAGGHRYEVALIRSPAISHFQNLKAATGRDAVQSKRVFAGRFHFGVRAIYRRFEIFGCLSAIWPIFDTRADDQRTN